MRLEGRGIQHCFDESPASTALDGLRPLRSSKNGEAAAFASAPSAASAGVGLLYPSEHGLIASRPIAMRSADETDAADAIFSPRAYPDHSRPRTAFTREGNLNAERAEERLRAPESTGEGPRVFCPCDPRCELIASTLRTQTQKVRGTPGPRGAIGHDRAYAIGYGICLDDALDGGSAICRVGAREGAGRPKCGFTRRSADRKIGHARQRLEVNTADLG